MPINETVQQAINDQIQRELSSAYTYLAMTAHFEAANLPGFARWMRLQSEEEQEHAMRLFDYLNDRGGRVVLQAIEQPKRDFGTPLAAFEAALHHEQYITRCIHELHALAGREHDPATQVMLQWFITEQVEEEKNASHVVETLKLIGDDRAALVALDRELGRREPE